jgi:hypothetical protein
MKRRSSRASTGLKQLALLGGSFALTLALLFSVWMVAGGSIGPRVTPTPRPTDPPFPTAPPATPTPVPSPTIAVTGAPSSTATPTLLPTLSPSPTPTQPPLRTPGPSVALPSTAPGDTQVFIVNGSDYVTADVPPGGVLNKVGTTAFMRTTTDSVDALWVTWRLDEASLPVGRTIHSVDVRICGSGQGHFWEVYGPDGGEPFEYEVVAPNDGDCWLFRDAPGHDLTVLGGVMLDSTMLITRVEYHVTFGE